MDKKIFKSYWHRKKDYQITPAEKVKRLILGDSHAVYGVYTEHRTPYTFNAAEISADLFTIFHIGKSCLAKFPHPLAKNCNTSGCWLYTVSCIKN